MRLEQLRYLIEIANCKSINKAAHNLYITQPALSIAINSLEEELNYPLLTRTKKGVVLTEDGARVVQDAQRIMTIIQNWYLSSETEYNLNGNVHIQATPSVCVAMSNTLILDMQQNYPNLSIFMHTSTPQHMLSAITNSAVNIGISQYSQEKEEDFLKEASKHRKLNVEKLIEDRRCVMISTKNPISKKDTLSSDDLKQLTLAYYSDTTDDVSEFYRNYFNPDRCFRLDSRESILQLIAEDGAVGIFPELTTRSSYYIRSGLIKPVFLDNKKLPTKITYYLIYPDLKNLSLNEICMLDIIREKFTCCLTNGRACDCIENDE